MKRTLIISLAIILLLGMVTFADELVELFTFEQLTTEAIDGSLSIDSAELTLESKELALEKLEEDAEINNYPGGNRVDHIKRLTTVLADPIVAVAEVKNAELALAKESVTIAADIYKKGMNYLILKDEVVLNNQLFDYKVSYMEYAKKKLESGISTSTDYTNKVIEAQSQELKQLELNSSLEAIAIEINHLLGHEWNAELNIGEAIVLSPFKVINVDFEYGDRVDNYPSVITKTANLEAKSIIFDLTADKYREVDKEYKIALANKKIAELELSDAKKSFEVSLRSAHNKYLNAYDSYLLTVKQNELAAKVYEEAVLKYDLGLISQEDMLKAEETKLNSDFSVTKAIYTYNVTKIDFINLY
jgi:hypothetical protein